ncbi:MAG: hypothetical protein B6U88_02270 [Candidatus Aenigmarchaeota archaeon ex4484_56]|nr:MAG: hypothetical protein B6U88_02270 [Candidatus Aenigmarchaeota archaeon ex4484_56]
MKIIDILTTASILVIIVISALFASDYISSETFIKYFTKFFLKLLIPFELNFISLIRYGTVGIIVLLLLVYILRKNF